MDMNYPIGHVPVQPSLMPRTYCRGHDLLEAFPGGQLGPLAEIKRN